MITFFNSFVPDRHVKQCAQHCWWWQLTWHRPLRSPIYRWIEPHRGDQFFWQINKICADSLSTRQSIAVGPVDWLLLIGNPVFERCDKFCPQIVIHRITRRCLCTDPWTRVVFKSEITVNRFDYQKLNWRFSTPLSKYRNQYHVTNKYCLPMVGSPSLIGPVRSAMAPETNESVKQWLISHTHPSRTDVNFNHTPPFDVLDFLTSDREQSSIHRQPDKALAW